MKLQDALYLSLIYIGSLAWVVWTSWKPTKWQGVVLVGMAAVSLIALWVTWMMPDVKTLMAFALGFLVLWFPIFFFGGIALSLLRKKK